MLSDTVNYILFHRSNQYGESHAYPPENYISDTPAHVVFIFVKKTAVKAVFPDLEKKCARHEQSSHCTHVAAMQQRIYCAFFETPEISQNEIFPEL